MRSVFEKKDRGMTRLPGSAAFQHLCVAMSSHKQSGCVTVHLVMVVGSRYSALS